MPRLLNTLAMVAAATAVMAACSSRGTPGRVPPAADFLFAAGDSTYWVRSGADGMRVRSAPILLTQVDGKFYEVFIAEDGVDYDDASFSTSRLWTRDITSRDSLLLFSDGTVMAEAARWKKRHPAAVPINVDDEAAPPDPHTIARDEIEIVDVHGPWLTFRQTLDIDIDVGEPHRHGGRRAVVDVRTGQMATLVTLFGAAEAERLVRAGRLSLAQLTDSIRKLGDERAELARGTLDSFRFDSTSFGLADVDRAPAVAFLVPGTSADGEALAIYLPPLAVAATDWWAAVEPTLPQWTRDSSRVRWMRRTYDVIARPTPDGASLSLVLTGRGGLREREWPIATVGAPAYQLIALDSPPLSSTLREALARAFDASSALDGLAPRALGPGPRRDADVRSQARLRLASVRRSR